MSGLTAAVVFARLPAVRNFAGGVLAEVVRVRETVLSHAQGNGHHRHPLRRRGGHQPWMIYFDVAIDLFSDGLMIGTGATIATSLGLLLALGQLPADIPEGFAVIANFRAARGVEGRRRLLIAAALAVPVLVDAVFGYFVVRGASR